MKKAIITISIACFIGLPIFVFAEQGGNGQNSTTDKKTLIEEKKAANEAKREEKKAEIEAKKEENQQQRLEKGKEKALQAIEKRIEQLDKVAARITERKRIREQEKNEISAAISEAKKYLEQEKEKVQNASNIETLKSTFKNAIENTRVYAVVVPKVRAIAMTSALYNGIDRMNKVFAKVEPLIPKLPADKQTEAKSLLADVKTQVALAKTKADAALAEFKKMKPSADVSAAKASLEAGKKYLTEGKDAIHKAVQNLNKIKEMAGAIVTEEATEATDNLKPEKTKTTPAAE